MFVAYPNGDVLAANDHHERHERRSETAKRANTPEGLFSMVDELGTKEAAARLHDAMFGEAAARETPKDTNAGRTAREWVK